MNFYRMNDDNKPIETDSQEGFQDIESLFEEGQEDVVGSEPTVESLTLEELNKIAGREFKSKDDFYKHYENLKSFVGKKYELKEDHKTAPQQPDVASKVAELEERIAQRDFVIENPEAKAHLDLIKSVSLGDKITLDAAWEKVKPIVEGAEAHKKELEIGVKSKNRVNPVPSQKLTELAERAKAGDTKASESLVAEWLGLNK